MHIVGLQALFSIAALPNLVFSLMPLAILFFRLMSPLSKDETGRECSPVQYFSGVVIVNMLDDRRCFLFFIKVYHS